MCGLQQFMTIPALCELGRYTNVLDCMCTAFAPSPELSLRNFFLWSYLENKNTSVL